MTPYAVRRAFKGIVEHRFLAVATIGTVATVLILGGAFLLVITNLSGLLDRWGQDVQVSCYLREDVGDEALFAIKAEIEAMPEVISVRYVSQDEALERFGEAVDGMDRILADLDSNPLPASLEVRLRPELQQPARVADVASRLSRPEFEDMDWSQEWVERFHTFLGLLRLSALVLGTLLLAAAMFLVNTTIRLAIHSRRDELEIIQLVGGTRWFARTPFVVEGMALGGLGALVALAVLPLLYKYAFVQLQASLGMLLSMGTVEFLPVPTLLGLFVAGLAVGFVGAFTSVIRSNVGTVS
ncbi:MAG: ABC transporter permease [Proteobacteria bacterium]|nr:ABC transporter permease [Pseudomonadota bacterium]